MDSDTADAFRDLSEKMGGVIEGQKNTLRYVENISTRTRDLDNRLQAHALDKTAHGAEDVGKVKDRHIAIASVLLVTIIGAITLAVEMRKGGNSEKYHSVSDAAGQPEHSR